MDDKFMYTLRKEPDKRFSQRLKQNLDEIALKPAKAGYTMGHLRLGMILVLALVVGAISLSLAVPGVRAKLQDLFIQIAGQTFMISQEYPGLGEAVTNVRPEKLPLQEAIGKLPFEVKTPSYIPAGFQLEKNVNLYMGNAGFPDSIEATYAANQRNLQRITLTARQNAENLAIAIGSEAVEEVMIGSEVTGALFKGGWFSNTAKWEDMDVWTLTWVQGDTHYMLIGPEAQQLIDMAASFN